MSLMATLLTKSSAGGADCVAAVAAGDDCGGRGAGVWAKAAVAIRLQATARTNVLFIEYSHGMGAALQPCTKIMLKHSPSSRRLGDLHRFRSAPRTEGIGRSPNPRRM